MNRSHEHMYVLCPDIQTMFCGSNVQEFFFTNNPTLIQDIYFKFYPRGENIIFFLNMMTGKRKVGKKGENLVLKGEKDIFSPNLCGTHLGKKI